MPTMRAVRSSYAGKSNVRWEGNGELVTMGLAGALSEETGRNR